MAAFDCKAVNCNIIVIKIVQQCQIKLKTNKIQPKDEREFSERNVLVPDLNCNEWIDKMS